eukprot:c28029_g2_i1 orf=594-1796(+)
MWILESSESSIFGDPDMYLEVVLTADQAATHPKMPFPRLAETVDTPDAFERLHDSILMQIFNKVGDVKALGRCCVVCKRLHSLVSLVDNVIVKVDCVISGNENSVAVKGRSVFGHLVRFVVGSVIKPWQVLQHILEPKKEILADVTHHSPREVLKNFKAIQHLRIELPGGELGVEHGVLLKWKAEFGSTLVSCVIIGASAILLPENKRDGGTREFGKAWFRQGRYGERVLQVRENVQELSQDDGGILPESFYTNGGLKLRVAWTISSLIAASARHYLLQQIITEHPTLVSLVLTDADGQGMLSMNEQQLEEFKNKPITTSASANRTKVPALNMKLWHAPQLELPGGTGLKGATLVVIRPCDKPMQEEVDDSISTAFDDPFKTAVSLLMKRRTYLLEMNSF